MLRSLLALLSILSMPAFGLFGFLVLATSPAHALALALSFIGA